MKDKLTLTIIAIGLFTFGGIAHSFFFPQNPLQEKEIEVFINRIVKVPTEKENYYIACQKTAYKTYISSSNGKLKNKVSPKDIENFIKQCLDYYEK